MLVQIISITLEFFPDQVSSTQSQIQTNFFNVKPKAKPYPFTLSHIANALMN